MNSKICKVRFIISKTCFVYLSEQNSGLSNGVTLKVNYPTNKVCYFTAQLSSTIAIDEIGINRLFAESMCLQENDSVMVSWCFDIPGIRRITVSPASQDDYEILELLAENIQSILLDQIRVVNLHQKFIIWVSNSLHAVVTVDTIEPVNPGRLDNLTEVVIAPPKTTEASNKTTFHNYFKVKPPLSDSSDLINKYLNIASDICYSLHPYSALEIDNVTHDTHFVVYVFHKFLPHYLKDGLFTLTIIKPAGSIQNETVKFVVRLITLTENVKRRLPVMYVHNCIFKNFNVQFGAKALLNSIEPFNPVVNKIELTLPAKNNSIDSVNVFKKFLFENCENKLLLNANFVLNVGSFDCSVRFFPSCNFCLIDRSVLKNCDIVLSTFDLSPLPPPIVKPEVTFCNYGDAKDIVENVLGLLKGFVVDGGAMPENGLIIGKPGTGKTTLANVITDKLTSHPYYMHTETLSCKALKGKTLESLQKVFLGVLLNLVYYQPSVLVLDDLHVICGKANEEETLSQESLQYNRISELVADILKTCAKQNLIFVLATSESTHHLNRHVYSTRGLHLFKHIYTIQNLQKEDRSEIAKHLLEEICELQDVNFDEIALKTEGFVVQDIVDFVRKAAFECFKEFSTEPKITMLHCEIGLKNTIALSLQDIQLHSPGDRYFDDIGGLEDAKTILTKTVFWPLKFPNIFEKAPLRLQSGLLLYGPPGNGKTILAGAAAKQFGLRLISVKGPELLSKYIGASEQAVRNTFERAQNAKPCILFFDEFDSLAPRRGHDSTGVTDRVVNQLLTQLDGVESLTGVCVLAATSRPDLLDPALLRPGRLDKQILCPLPNTESRLRILKSLSKRMSLGSDADLSAVAEKTEGFSGADLQAVLYTAQLSVVQDVTNSIEGEIPDVIEINQKHLLAALISTRPSLTPHEITKYELIYKRFERGNIVTDVQAGLQKATLA